MFDFLRQEYAAARLRAMKGRLLKREKFLKLMGATSLSELVNLLEGTDYEPIFHHILQKDVMVMENELDRLYVKLLEKIKGFYHGKEKWILDILLKEWVLRNLKLVVRSLLGGERFDEFLIPVEGFDLERVSGSRSMEEFVSKLKGTDYYEPVYSGYRELKEFGPYIIDFRLEECYVRMFLYTIEEAKEKEILLSYLKIRNDLLNLRNIYRSIISKKDLGEFFLQPSHVQREWFKVESVELFLEKMRFVKYDLRGVAELEDDLLFEIALGRNLERVVEKFLNVSPFDTGLLLYFLVMKRNEINRIKVITRFVKEGLDKGMLKWLLGLGE